MSEWREYLRIKAQISYTKSNHKRHGRDVGLYCWRVIFAIDVVLRGIAQVFLCNNPLSGVLILAGLALSSPVLSYYSLLGCVGSTVGAYFLAGSALIDVANGLCGYDGALVGCALFTFSSIYNNDSLGQSSLSVFAFALFVLLFSIISGIVHVSVCQFFTVTQLRLPAFTIAFNIVLIMLLFALKQGQITSINNTQGNNKTNDENIDTITFFYFIDAVIRGVGQFMFADTTEGSFLVLLAILLASFDAFIAALSGSFVAFLVAAFIFDVIFFPFSIISPLLSQLFIH